MDPNVKFAENSCSINDQQPRNFRMYNAFYANFTSTIEFNGTVIFELSFFRVRAGLSPIHLINIVIVRYIFNKIGFRAVFLLSRIINCLKTMSSY